MRPGSPNLMSHQVFAIALTAIVLLANQQYGWDRHVYDIPLKKIIPTSKIAMAAKVIFTCAATFTRLSLLCFYYRLVSDTGKKWFVWGIHVNVAFSVGIFFSFVCLAIFQCNPVSKSPLQSSASNARETTFEIPTNRSCIS